MAGSGGSGGGSVGGGFSGGFSGGGFHGGFGHTTIINRPRYSGPGGGGNNGNGSNNPLIRIGFYIFIGIIALSVFAIADTAVEDDYYFSDDLYGEVVSLSPYEDDEVNYLITEKLPLDAEYCIPTGRYITDSTQDGEFGRIDGPLESELIGFYEKTGIEPHVYFFDYPFDGYLYDTALNLYYELFEDEGHLLLALACDSFDYEYEIIIGDDTLEILNEDALAYLNDNINNEMYSADYGYYDSVMDGLCNAFSMTAEKIMFDYVYIGDSNGEDVSEEPVTDDGPVSDVPPTTEKDALEEFIENEFGSHETTDEIDEIFGKIESAMETVSITGVLAILAVFVVFGGAIIAAIVISRKRNNYEPDVFGEDDSKFDGFMK